MADNQRHHPERLVAAKVRPQSLTTTTFASLVAFVAACLPERLLSCLHACPSGCTRGPVGNELDLSLPSYSC